MGIIGTILYNFKNIKRANKLRSMSESEWINLDDESFYDSISCVCYNAVYDINDKEVNNIQKTVYSLIQFETEVNNGGLCQFFVNSSRECAPYISESLTLIGAEKIKNLFDDFIYKNNIDVTDLTSFILKDIDAYKAQTERFDFDSFDDKFYEEENLHAQIIAYARKNLKDILSVS